MEGKLRTDEYEKDGVKRYSTDVIADEMQMLGSRGGGEAGANGGARERPERGPPRGAQPAPGKMAPQSTDQFDDDEIPF